MNLANAYCRLIQKWRKQNRFINVINTKWTHLNLWMFYDVWISSMCICGWPVNLVKIYHLLLSLELNFFFLKYHLKGYLWLKWMTKRYKKKKNNSCGEHVHVLPEAYVGDWSLSVLPNYCSRGQWRGVI